jgi:polyhydroxybutyrate depolymerase
VPANDLPLLMVLHGMGGTSELQVQNGDLVPFADRNRCWVVCPSAIDRAWNVPGWPAGRNRDVNQIDDEGYLNALLDTLQRRFAPDPTRFYLAGVSRGGYMTHYLCTRPLGKRFVAVGTFIASHNLPHVAAFSQAPPKPVFILAGTQDPLVLYQGGERRTRTAPPEEGGADYIGADSLVALAVQRNGANPLPTVRMLPNPVSDGCVSEQLDYLSTTAPVRFVRVNGGGHGVPGTRQYLGKGLIGTISKDYNGFQLLWDFLSEHHR